METKINFKNIHKQRQFVIIAACVGILGSIMPWISFPFLGSISGLKLFGKFTILLFGLILYFVLSGDRTEKVADNLTKKVNIPAILSSILGLVTLFSDVDEVNVFGGFMAPAGTFSLGIYLVILGGIAIPVIIKKIKDDGFENTQV